MSLAGALEHHVDLLEARGMAVRTVLAEPLEAAEVRAAFRSIRLDPPDDAVALWSWHNGLTCEPFTGPEIFWETGQFRPLAEFIDHWSWWQGTLDSADAEPEWRQWADARELFPGPRDLFPIMLLDEREALFMDCGRSEERGTIWFGFDSEAPSRLFDDLSEGLASASYCLEAGLWQVNPTGYIECERDIMPATADRDHPPWRPRPL